MNTPSDLMNFNTPVTAAQAQFKLMSDEDLFFLHAEYPSVTDMQGYSSEAKLQLAINLSALKAELILRSLVPFN